MAIDGVGRLEVQTALRNLLVDQVSAEVSGLFAAAGIDCMLVKGPVIADWLYPDVVRRYGDSDLLVSPANWERAKAVLVASGFRDALGPMAHPRMESLAGTAFERIHETVDLHCTIAGLEATPAEVWDALWSGAQQHEVARRPIAVPNRPAALMHLALHAAHHPGMVQPTEDLRRGLISADAEEWRQAAELAARLGGLPAFATGLRCLPAGQQLARALGLDGVGSVRHDLRAAGVPIAEGLNDLLTSGLSWRQRLSMLSAELFPKPSFMRWWTPVASRGIAGLAVAYVQRWLWLAVKLPGGIAVLLRVRRQRRGS